MEMGCDPARTQRGVSRTPRHIRRGTRATLRQNPVARDDLDPVSDIEKGLLEYVTLIAGGGIVARAGGILAQ